MSGNLSEQDRVAQGRVRRVFEYLKALNEHRNPTVRQVRERAWTMWLDDLPSHAAIELPKRVARAEGEPGGENGESAAEPDFVLRVGRPKLTNSPAPPAELRDWLRPDWDDPHKEAEHLESRDEPVHASEGGNDGEGETVTVRFEDDPARVEAWRRWREERAAWREVELPARAAMTVFDRLHALHGQVERESERFDLVVGDGVLSWRRPEGNIYHPLLLQRVQLVFDAKAPEFRVVDADFDGELYDGLFQSIAEVDPRALRARREEFEAAGLHPLDREASGLLAGLANQLAAHGEFVGEKRPEPAAPHPAIGRGAVLFLRARAKGYGPALERLLETLPDRDDFCDALRNIVGCDAAEAAEDFLDGEPTADESERPARDILFGKPANPEQLRIARAVVRHGSVLVQGPPGTGKSHTIANLIGHMLAHGQSVLVTSHTTKALRVLREHVVEELRPLCVNVLESDLDSRRQLEESVQTISRRLSESDAETLEREAEQLERRRSDLIDALELQQAALKNARADEYRDVVFGGEALAPSEAARLVAAGRGADDWIPGPVALGAPCPLSPAEVRELYATNGSTRPEDDARADRALPEAGELPSPEETARNFQESARLAESGELDRRYWPGVHFTAKHIGQLDALIDDLKAAVEEFEQFEQADDWRLAAVDAGRAARADGPWNHLLAKIDETAWLASEAETALVLHRPEVGEEPPLEAQKLAADAIHRHLESGGGLGWLALLFHPSWKQTLAAWKVGGRTPQTAEEVAAVRHLLSLRIARDELRLLWNGLMAAHGAPGAAELGEAPERGAGQYAASIRDAFEWWPTRWTPWERRLRELGFDWDRFLGEQPPDLRPRGEMRRVMTAARGRLLGELERTRNQLEALLFDARLDALLKRLGEYDRPEAAALRSALENKDAEAYARARQACRAAAERQKIVLRRRELLAKLAPSKVGRSLRDRQDGSRSAPAPATMWAEAIRDREGVHGQSAPPGDVERAWRWRQLNDELARRAEVDLERLGRRIEDIQVQLKDATNQLIDRKAWAGQVRRVGLRQRQALNGWMGIIDRIGKGYGRRVPRLRREARRKMAECREAVPVWVMPLSRLVENFDFSAPRFDVVIIDEASQCDVLALAALALAHRVIVVGDDKQVSPAAVGQDLNIVENLIRMHLDGIPNAVLYDGRMSIYDLARQSFPGGICLLEHFRCVPDIIQFSNHLSYEGAIKPLREQASSPLTPRVAPYRVEGGIRGEGKVNAEEARAVASLIVAACEHETYADQTFGVISLVGDDQAREIERLLLRHLAPDEYVRRRITCGNSAQFQGDERDAMFLSMVDSPGDGPLSMRDYDSARQRLNVAASRAKNQMWVVYSLNHEVDLKPGDIRRRLIEHALDPAAVTRELDRARERVESPFERLVYERLARRGYRVRPQWPVGRYRIDLVVEDGERRLAVECDGDRYHPIEKLAEDMQRQAILERLGWRFVRIRGSVFFRDPDAAMAPVWKKLDEMGIHPAARDLQIAEEPEQSPALEEIIRRAAELRARWRNCDNTGERGASAP